MTFKPLSEGSHPATGDVVLSRKPTHWQGLLDVVAQNTEEELLIEHRPATAQPL